MVKIRLPQLLELYGKPSGKNEVMQTRNFPVDDEFSVTPYQVDRRQGVILQNAVRKIFVSNSSGSPPAGVTEQIRVHKTCTVETLKKTTDYTDPALAAKWILPVTLDPTTKNVTELETYCQAVRSSWAGRVSLREELLGPDGKIVPGYRPPQTGALYSALAHWKVTSDPATVVMPTGTGKTETMLALFLHQQMPRLMVIVPTHALRDQIGGKFTSLGVLRNFNLVHPAALNPVVGILKSKPKTGAEVDEIFRRCNVVVSTMAVAGNCEPLVQKRMASHCSHLFIDEAHHIQASTWEEFRLNFETQPILQFTATPYRNDGKLVDGRVIFNYPLAKAQKEDYFRPIKFESVYEFDPEKSDEKIAVSAIKQLREDLAKGYDHLLMARASTIVRANKILPIYERLAPDLKPQIFYSTQASTAQKIALKQVFARTSKVIVCVNMFGEGFDLPELKIAALHDVHKSLAITLQFTGRFTRSKSTIGNATVVANTADQKVELALTELYAEDADWNSLLQGLSQGATARQIRRTDFLREFSHAPEKIPLQNIFPKMSAVVFKTKCANWKPLDLNIEEKNVKVFAGPSVNEKEKVLLYVTRETEEVPWGAIKGIQNTLWHLYLAYWNKTQGLLFINSSNKNGAHAEIAKALVGESAELVRGEGVFRALNGVKRLMLTNLGLSHAISRSVRHSMHSGSDVAPGLSEAQAQNKTKTNLFGRGFENGGPVTIGCSRKGRLWSYKIAYDLTDWMDWCNKIGAKLLDTSISTEIALKSIICPYPISQRPNLVPLTIEWPDEFYGSDEDVIQFDFGTGSTCTRMEVELELVNHDTSGPIKFLVKGPEKSIEYTLNITKSGATYTPSGTGKVEIIRNGKKKTLSEAFDKEYPIVRFENGSFLIFNEMCEMPTGSSRLIYDEKNIIEWNWAGIDLKKESQKSVKHKDSIQRKVIEELLSSAKKENLQVIFDDDDSGEAADIITISTSGEKLDVQFFHCKFSKEEKPGARVDDLYAVCGQTQKSIHWRSNIEGLIKHMLKRDAKRIQRTGVSRFELGDQKTLQLLLRQCRLMEFRMKMYIVQPGLSKSAAIEKQKELLAATELYLRETYDIDFGVITSP